jgi:zinc protease
MRRLVAVAIIVASACGIVSAQDLKMPLPKDPKVIKGKFANGLVYYIRPNSKPEKKVELRLIVNTGSIMEDNDQQGLAHFMEHMNFNGTKNFQKNDLVSYLQSIGVQFGADLNAYTSFDETVYILPIPTDKPGNLDKGFQIIEDWAHNALLTDKDIDGERGVVLEESRLGKGADDRMLKKYLPRLLNGSPYKDRLPIGKDEILKNFKYDVIRRFYRDWYRPDLQAVAIVGDIDEATAMAYLKKHFEGLKNPAKERPRVEHGMAELKASDAMVVTDKEATSYEFGLIFSNTKQSDEITLGDYRNDMVKGLISNMWNRRLRDLTRSANPPFTSASVDYGGIVARKYEGLSANATFGANDLDKAINALTAELLRAKQFGFTSSELELAKKEMTSSVEKLYNERNTTESGNLIWEYVRNYLVNEPIPGIENEYEYYKQLMPGIALEEANKMVKDWMVNMNTFALVTGPSEGAKLPTDAELLAKVKAAFQQEVKPMEEKKVSSELLTTKPTPGKVVSRTEDKEMGTTTLTLSNGVKVTLKSTDFKSDEIMLRGVKNGGLCNYGAEDKYNATFAASVVASMGWGNFTPTDLEKALAGKTAKLGVGIGDIENTVSGSSSVKDFETMLQLMYLKLTMPRKDEALFAAYKTKQKTQLQFTMANPQTAFIDTLYKAMYYGQPLAPIRIPKPAYFDAINVDRAIGIYQEQFTRADGYNFYIVGNVNIDQAIPLIEMYMGGIRQLNIEAKFKDNGVRALKGVNTLKFKKGKEKKSLIVGVYHGELPYTEDLDMKGDMLIEVMNIKVIEELREKMGGTYSGGFQIDFKKDPYSRYSISLGLPCGPENVDKLIKGAEDIIADVKKNGCSNEDLDKVKNTMHEQVREAKKDNGFWVENMVEIMFRGGDKKYLLDFDNVVNSYTTADIKAAANTFFDGKNQIIAVLYPEDDAK